MTSSRKKWGFITVGLVAALSLGAIGVAGAATGNKATPSPSAAANADGTHVPDGDRDGHTPDGDHAGRGGHGRGGGDIAEALANLTKTDVNDIMAQRASGTSFAAIAAAKGISTQALLAEATRIETAELDAAVKAGQLTDAQRTQILAGLQAHLKEELTETHALPGDGGRGCDGNAGGRGANGTSGTASPSASPSASGAALTF
ncbi:MAG: hypothetical protein NTX16_12140 [Actinobacteria bacterium]|nr:hypothetical protein [Actinomycetota bacterium]